MSSNTSKEAYYLNFNQDEVFKNLLASEGHFRNVDPKQDSYGFMNCIVKHLADAEGHADEAISHALIVKGKADSQKFNKLRDELKSFRKKLQESSIDQAEGIKEIRRIRRYFESFNPKYDVSKCQSCGDIDGFIKEFNATKNLNTPRNNYSIVDDNMPSKSKVSGKDIALMYGGQWIGLGVNAGIDSFLSQYGMPLKLGLAALLPVATYFVKMPKYLAEVLILTGGYLSTKLPDYVGQYMPAATVRRATVVTTAPRVVTPTGIQQSKYIIT